MRWRFWEQVLESESVAFLLSVKAQEAGTVTEGIDNPAWKEGKNKKGEREIVRYSRNWSVSNLEGAEPQIWENLYI